MTTAACPVLSALFAPDVVTVRSVMRAVGSDVLPSERDHVAQVSERRRTDFLNGRACAHACIAALGVPDAPVVVGPGGAPVWPPGVVGSITHCEGYSGAVATLSTKSRSLGVDAERRARVERGLESLICTEVERADLDRRPESERSEIATLLFSAKEAFYKAQFGVSGHWVDFLDVAVEPRDGSFTVTLGVRIPGLGCSGDRFTGRYVVLADHVFCGIEL